MRLLKNTSLVGLDLRPGKLRLLQLQKTGADYRIQQAAGGDLPEEIFSQGKIRDFSALGAVLAPLVKRLGLTGSVAAIQLPLQLVYYGCIRLPGGLTDKAIAAQVQLELTRQLPDVKTELWFDYQKGRDGQSAYLVIQYVAARAAYLRQYIACVRASGLQVKMIDVDMFALVRLLRLECSSRVYGVIVRENSRIGMVLFATGTVVFHRFWPSESAQELQRHLRFYAEHYPGGAVSPCYFFDMNEEAGHALSGPGLQIEIPQTFLTAHYPVDYSVAAGLAMRRAPGW